MSSEKDHIFLLSMRHSLEQLNEKENELLWELFLNKKLLNKYSNWSNRYLYWEYLNWALLDLKAEQELKDYVEMVTDIYLRESLRDRMSLLYKKNILWTKGAAKFFEVLGYSEKATEQQFSEDLGFQPLTLIYFDLDYFKAYNDLFGHIGGDLVIKRVARYLLENYQNKNNLSFRIAGEEFFIFLNQPLSVQESYDLSKKIQQGIYQVMKDLFAELGQIHNINFTYQQALDFIEDKLERYILEKRATDINGEFNFNYQNILKAEVVELQEKLNQCQDKELLLYYEARMNDVAIKLEEQKVFDEQSDLKKYYFNLQERFFIDNFETETLKPYFLKYKIQQKEDLTPSKFITLLKDLLNIANPYLRTKFHEIYDRLKIKVGGLTMGVCYLKWDKDDRYTAVPFNLANQIYKLLLSLVAVDNLEISQQEFKKFFHYEALTYHKLYYFLFKYIDTKERQFLLQIINAYRVDNLLEKVGALEEQQKRQQRNAINFKSLSLTDLENQSNIKDLRVNKHNKIFAEHQNLKVKVKLIMGNNLSLMKHFTHSPVNKWWAKLSKKIKEFSSQDDYLQRKAKTWREVLTYRYFDPLLGVFNDQYLLDFEYSNYWFAKRNNLDYTVVALDFDNLKAVNEAANHYCGDLVLMYTVLYLYEAFDYFADKYQWEDVTYPRLIRATPGEEFLLVFAKMKAEEVKNFLDQVTHKITQKIHLKLDELGVLKDIKYYLQEKNYINNECLSSIGTFTSGIVNAKDYYKNQPDWDFENLQNLVDEVRDFGKERGKGKNYLSESVRDKRVK